MCWKISFLGLYGRDPPTFAHFIYTLIPRQTEASARAWIDAFFFRVSAMLPPNQRMVLNVEHAVPATTISPSNLSTLSGFVDYTAVAASQRAAGKSTSTHLNHPHRPPPANFLTSPQLYVLKSQMPSSFFVVEAKLLNPSDHVPQAGDVRMRKAPPVSRSCQFLGPHF